MDVVILNVCVVLLTQALKMLRLAKLVLKVCVYLS